jgi:hypothetical protein
MNDGGSGRQRLRLAVKAQLALELRPSFGLRPKKHWGRAHTEGQARWSSAQARRGTARAAHPAAEPMRTDLVRTQRSMNDGGSGRQRCGAQRRGISVFLCVPLCCVIY